VRSGARSTRDARTGGCGNRTSYGGAANRLLERVVAHGPFRPRERVRYRNRCCRNGVPRTRQKAPWAEPGS
jgi:hypothetical protein